MRSLRRFALFTCGVAAFFSAGRTEAQAPDSVVVAAPPEWVSPRVAVGLEYLLPTAGHAYAGDWARGVPPALVQVAGGTFFARSALRCLCVDRPAVVVGGVVFLTGKAWAMYSAYRTAEDRNDALRVTVGPARGALGVGVTVGLSPSRR